MQGDLELGQDWTDLDGLGPTRTDSDGLGHTRDLHLDIAVSTQDVENFILWQLHGPQYH